MERTGMVIHFAGRASPLKVMYLDESGNHDLKNIKPDYPVFVLGGVIVDREYSRTTLKDQLRYFKLRFFGRDDIVLHTADIVRGKNGFEMLKRDPTFKNDFYDALNELMSDLQYTVVACAIRNEAHVKEYGGNALDPYRYSLDILVERFCLDIGDVMDGGLICAESRRPDLDRALYQAWEHIKVDGTGYVTNLDIDKHIIDLGIREKFLNIPGLQLADLVVSPIGRYVMGKTPQKDWDIVKSKFRRVGGNYLGPGLVIRP
jgi:hypothetical protein